LRYRNDVMPDELDAIDTTEVLEKLERLESLLLQCRSVFPTVTQELIGNRSFATPSYYLRRGYKARVQLSEPITIEFIERNRQLGKWINENTLIRLYGILSYHGFFKKINQTLPGGKEMDLLRRMRDALTKTPLNYRPGSKKNIRLREEIMRHFSLRKEDFPEKEIPTPIDTVVEPIFRSCREYIVAHSAPHNKRVEATPGKKQGDVDA
jgi:hypothetical protein